MLGTGSMLKWFRFFPVNWRTGATFAQIAASQNASGGMWAFTEGNEVIYLVTLIYLFWPIAFNLLAFIRRTLFKTNTGGLAA